MVRRLRASHAAYVLDDGLNGLTEAERDALDGEGERVLGSSREAIERLAKSLAKSVGGGASAREADSGDAVVGEAVETRGGERGGQPQQHRKAMLDSLNDELRELGRRLCPTPAPLLLSSLLLSSSPLLLSSSPPLLLSSSPPRLLASSPPLLPSPPPLRLTAAPRLPTARRLRDAQRASRLKRAMEALEGRLSADIKPPAHQFSEAGNRCGRGDSEPRVRLRPRPPPAGACAEAPAAEAAEAEAEAERAGASHCRRRSERFIAPPSLSSIAE